MLPGDTSVTLLRHSVGGLLDISWNDNIDVRIAEQMLHRTGRRPSPSEQRSWARSIPVLLQDLRDAGLDRIEVLVEYQLPLTSKRADVILAGLHPRTREPSYVVVELKQWSSAVTYDGDTELVLIDGRPHDPLLHPAVQVRGYCDYIVDFTATLHDKPNTMTGAAYLHNATDDAVSTLFDHPQTPHGRLFTGQRRGDFLQFLRDHLAPDIDGAPAADQLLSSRIAPSRQLLTVAAEEIRGREQFVLLAEQRLAYSTVLHAVERARRGDNKTVVVITGGPGSGKSVIALSLLGELARRGREVMHATGSRSFTQTLRKVVGRGPRRAPQLFKYFNQFMDAERNSLDVLILDEAHRIRETSVDRFTRAAMRTDRPQVDELIDAARVPVFLLDQHQIVKPGELGSPEQIEQFAKSKNLDVRRIRLDGQFRCGGSAEYLDWVQRLLDLTPGGPILWSGDPAFQVDVADSIEELEAALAAKLEAGYGARMAAGYCWPWSDPRRDGTLVPDVTVGPWSRPWNLKGDRAVGGAPPAALWASDPAGFGQVGCIYTAQGFEYDWNGVIIGPDLVWRNGTFRTRRAHNTDPNFRNTKKVADVEFDRLVRNVYKVLLTRGMIGTLIYATDAETRAALRSLVENPAAAQSHGSRTSIAQ